MSFVIDLRNGSSGLKNRENVVTSLPQYVATCVPHAAATSVLMKNLMKKKERNFVSASCIF